MPSNDAPTALSALQQRIDQLTDQIQSLTNRVQALSELLTTATPAPQQVDRRTRVDPDHQPSGPKVDPNAWGIVRDLVPSEHPQTIRTDLALRIGTLLKGGTDEATVREALELWLRKPSLGPALLPQTVSEVLRRRSAPPTTGTAPDGGDRNGYYARKAQNFLDAGEQLIAQLEAGHTPDTLRGLTA